MSALDKIKITLNGIGQFLKMNKLIVPKYQRDFAWEEKHVTDLLDDIHTAIRNNESEYFIGSIVIKQNKDNRSEVVDGQQRLATITILIQVISSIFEKNGENKRAFQIANDYLLSHDLRTEEEEPHLILNQNDQDFFVENILKNEKIENVNSLRSSHQRLYDTKIIIRKRLENIFSSSNNDLDILVDWIEYISTNVRVIWVEVPDYSNAFTIFETLNDRGLDLAISDLLKNYLFHKSGKSIEKAQNKWISMVSVLEAMEDDSAIVPYIKYLWASLQGNVREKDLYNQIKDNIKTKSSAMEFADQLAQNASLYVAIIHSDHSFWSNYSSKTRNNIRIINLLGMVQVRPLLLSVLNALSKKETEKSIESIVSIIVRLLVSGTLSSGVFERQFSITAMKVRNGEIKTNDQILAGLKSIIPSDTKFYEEFTKTNVSKSAIAKYYLATIENYIRDKNGSELIPNNDDEIVNLEHILPKRQTNEWSQFSEDEHKMYFKRLGNQTLLNSKKNSKLGNVGFDRKLEVFKESEFLINGKFLSDDDAKWGIKEINSRQKMMADYAIKIWKLR